MCDAGQMRRLFRALRKQGWVWDIAGSGHWRFMSPTGALVFASKTPRSARSFKDCVADLKRQGFEKTW
jgi:hypothetical protein